MELMSFLLLCTLLAYFPQTLGQENSLDADYRDLNKVLRSNSTSIYSQKSKEQMLDPKVNLMSFVSDLEYILMDTNCKKCVLCMERAIKVYKSALMDLVTKKPTEPEAQKNLIVKPYDKIIRPKRNSEPVKAKKSKGKKKSSKTVTVTKYSVDSGVYGLKVQETIVHGKNNETSCHVYSVKKTYQCNSPESDMFLSSKKKKINKSKKEKVKDKSIITTTQKAHVSAPSFRKRQIDQSEMPENFDFSIEELY